MTTTPEPIVEPEVPEKVLSVEEIAIRIGILASTDPKITKLLKELKERKLTNAMLDAGLLLVTNGSRHG
jgi:hypothetical protein